MYCEWCGFLNVRNFFFEIYLYREFFEYYRYNVDILFCVVFNDDNLFKDDFFFGMLLFGICYFIVWGFLVIMLFDWILI